MRNSETFLFDGPVGPLEAVLEMPAETAALSAVALVLHPHPLQEGTMHNKVAYMLARSFVQLGAPALRFNFRGVGKSAGRYDNAVGETDDAVAALDWLHKRWPQADLWLGGFSFGAQVALRAVTQRPVRRLVTVAPPVARFSAQLDALPDCDWLLIQGDADDVVNPDEVLNWARALSQPPAITVLPGAGHFFHGRLNDLRDAVVNHFLTTVA